MRGNLRGMVIKLVGAMALSGLAMALAAPPANAGTVTWNLEKQCTSTQQVVVKININTSQYDDHYMWLWGTTWKTTTPLSQHPYVYQFKPTSTKHTFYYYSGKPYFRWVIVESQANPAAAQYVTSSATCQNAA